MRLFLILAVAFGLSGCMEVPAGAEKPAPGEPAQEKAPVKPTRQAALMFVSVAKAIEPVAEAQCRELSPKTNCDFKIVIDDKDGGEANAHQFLTRSGRPILLFNYALINDARNADELAFVMGHEAAHHIAGHLAMQEINARQGAEVLAQMASVNGANSREIRDARKLGAALGALRYSKDFELEADELGTVISLRAGFNPVIGARFFGRIADPGDKMLGTHPPNSQRIALVRRTVRQYRQVPGE
ncbi:M48 family metallopeptidase [Thalassovita aquimarina]|uniref:M48 family metallopeptidase n=1 Tax=Thalassovita aquimarina TaxID=2785917 RepID=A0ABS5HPW7_9RHOB|nr:M48 family metallopeptidase [Thalassovita aquimarina]MBR9650995.1 M48 family metallopeptidase [Thalassovita aquimarina]